MSGQLRAGHSAFLWPLLRPRIWPRAFEIAPSLPFREDPGGLQSGSRVVPRLEENGTAAQCSAGPMATGATRATSASARRDRAMRGIPQGTNNINLLSVRRRNPGVQQAGPPSCVALDPITLETRGIVRLVNLGPTYPKRIPITAGSTTRASARAMRTTRPGGGPCSEPMHDRGPGHGRAERDECRSQHIELDDGARCRGRSDSRREH